MLNKWSEPEILELSIAETHLDPWSDKDFDGEVYDICGVEKDGGMS